jgi:hypothetical protein
VEANSGLNAPVQFIGRRWPGFGEAGVDCIYNERLCMIETQDWAPIKLISGRLQIIKQRACSIAAEKYDKSH